MFAVDSYLGRIRKAISVPESRHERLLCKISCVFPRAASRKRSIPGRAAILLMRARHAENSSSEISSKSRRGTCFVEFSNPTSSAFLAFAINNYVITARRK